MTKVHRSAQRLTPLLYKNPPSLRPSIRVGGIRNVQTLPVQHNPAIAQQPGLDGHADREKPALSLVPLPALVRSYAITALSSYPFLVQPSLKILSTLAHSSSPILNPDRNRLLHFILKKTFYAQFCAGETTREVQETARRLRDIGFTGVMLCFGKEIVLERGDKSNLCATGPSGMVDGTDAAPEDVRAWEEGTLQTVSTASPGDFVALKFSGAGPGAMRQLVANLPPGEAIEKATTKICELAKARGVRLLSDAEQNAVQRGIDAWTMRFQQRYNKGKAVVYGTYQAYLRSSPETLARHLAVAEREAFVLGVKLVRGAYMATDARELFWGTKEETDKVYDGIAEALMTRQWNDILRPIGTSNSPLPAVSLVLASHNQHSIKKAVALQAEQIKRGEPRIDVSYAQLMGMADEISCELVAAYNKNKSLAFADGAKNVEPRAYKYLVWGTVGECLKYLVRRAEENREAVTRAKGTRMALRRELTRRIWGRGLRPS
ncbi:MAG: hypothetical protein Q9163_002501 [Psora crenata]